MVFLEVRDRDALLAPGADEAEADAKRQHADKLSAETRADTLETAISAAIGSNRWLDPPDGGDVSLAEQVTRMREALESAETELARLRSTTEMVSDKRVGEAFDRSRTP